CYASCANISQCELGYACVSGSCVLGLGLGAACSNANQCASTFCVDGLCCNTPCNGQCQSCKLANTLGTCTQAAPNADPDNECGGGYTCGAPQSDGGSACRASCA